MASNVIKTKVMIEFDRIRTTPCLLDNLMLFASEYTRFWEIPHDIKMQNPNFYIMRDHLSIADKHS